MIGFYVSLPGVKTYDTICGVISYNLPAISWCSPGYEGFEQESCNSTTDDIYIYIYIDIYTCMIYIYIYIYLYIYIYIMYVCMYVYIICMYVYIYIRIIQRGFLKYSALLPDAEAVCCFPPSDSYFIKFNSTLFNIIQQQQQHSWGVSKKLPIPALKIIKSFQPGQKAGCCAAAATRSSWRACIWNHEIWIYTIVNNLLMIFHVFSW